MQRERLYSPTRAEFAYRSETMTAAHWITAVLAGATGFLHLFLYYEQGFVPFLFAGVVFLIAIIAMVLNVYRAVLYALGIPFTAGQVAMWYAQGMPDMDIAMVDKPVQLLLIGLLVYLLYVEWWLPRQYEAA